MLLLQLMLIVDNVNVVTVVFSYTKRKTLCLLLSSSMFILYPFTTLDTGWSSAVPKGDDEDLP